MKNIEKFLINNPILQIILLITLMTIGGHLFLTYLKTEVPLPNIKVIEDRVRLKKKV